jgi:hypothetical protein
MFEQMKVWGHPAHPMPVCRLVLGNKPAGGPADGVHPTPSFVRVSSIAFHNSVLHKRLISRISCYHNYLSQQGPKAV